MIDLNYLLERQPDFYELSQANQVKYVAFMRVKNAGGGDFSVLDIREDFILLNLVVPSNLKREVNKLTTGKMPILVCRGNRYVFHPKADAELTLELFGASQSVDPQEISKKKDSIELFSKYELHPEIKRVSFSQFQDGYYKEAIQNAFVEVVDQVKRHTGHPKMVRQNGSEYELDGDDLMQKAFAADGAGQPLVAFNGLLSSLDRAEQRGIMYLFKGVVGIRDKKAHLNYVQNDPVKTMEYLSLASLLLRLLDENAK